jgi:lipoprotein-anchoring transpeptidase ErfK/SrfK
VHTTGKRVLPPLTPETSVTASVFPSEGLSVGIGQPIVFRFDHFISSRSARAALVSHLDITESHPVLGGWRWFNDGELHFRPQGYWPAHERVTAAWDLRGWNAGDGRWGDGHGAVHFEVGDAHVSFADLATHRMTVTDNGRVIATYPISAGKAADPTMNGIHIVLDRESVVHMVSSTNGVPVSSPDGYDELVYSDVHISDSGEYVHAAPWSVNSQGLANVSHGCINLSPDNALAFFAFSRVGDVVLVGGGPRPPAFGDHGVMDWDTEWGDFAPANAILSVPASLAVLR